MMVIHSNTGSGAAAGDGLGVAAMAKSNRVQIERIREKFFMGPLLLGKGDFG
jgi:hypothetical protein